MWMKRSGRLAAILTAGVALFWVTLASGQNPADSDCVVSQNGVCLDAVIRNAPADVAAPKPAPVTFKKGKLTITADGISLREILNAVSSQAGVDITLPQQGLEEKVAVHLGPASTRDVLVDLLNGSSFNYVMLASPNDPSVLQHLVLTSRSAMPDAPVMAAAAPPQPAEAAPALYGQGFSTETSEPDNSEAEAQRLRNAEWASKQGAVIDQMQKARLKQEEEEQQQQQQSPQSAPPAAPQPE